MFETLTPPPPDKILQLMSLFAEDPRDDKIDLGVGVYKDAEGRTPVMRAVKAGEKRLLAEQATKSYVGLLGDLSFVDGMADLILRDAVDRARLSGAQTPGGTGALRQLFELIRRSDPQARVWMSDPTWPNHPAMLAHLGIPTATYRYFDAETLGVDFEGMKADLAGAKSGDVVLLHGCCHNPTGANLSRDQWASLTEIFVEHGLAPLIDMAYQGFGDGLDEDAAGVRHMAARVPEMLIAASCSKNFGLYRDRVGVALALSATPDAACVTKANMATLNRLNFSFPPDHGAKVVSIILNDADLRADWMAELEEMRRDMLTLRTGLAEALRRETNTDRFDFIADHRGMFSRLGLGAEQVAALRADHGIYMVGDSRVNIAGLPRDGLERIARAMVATSG
jgi:aspartate aminotransferase